MQCTLGKTPPHAEKGETPLFIGGDQSAAIALTEIFLHMSIPHYVGTADAACAVKLISKHGGHSQLGYPERMPETGPSGRLAVFDPVAASGRYRGAQFSDGCPWAPADPWRSRPPPLLWRWRAKICASGAPWPSLGPHLPAMETARVYFQRRKPPVMQRKIAARYSKSSVVEKADLNLYHMCKNAQILVKK